MVASPYNWRERHSEHAMTGRVLVIDDDEGICRLMTRLFETEGLDVQAAHDGPSGLTAAANQPPDLVLLDIQLPGINGLEVLEELKARMPSVAVVMLTGSRDIKHAVRATQLGAFDYLTKPATRDEILIVVRRALETRALRLEVQALRRDVGQGMSQSLAAQMGPSPQVEQIVAHVGIVAASNFTVLVVGETGTGKELVAQAIHQLSDRRRRPFVALDCGAIPEALLESELFGHEKGAFTGAERRKEGRFRLAEGGTCFLDEVGNLPMNLQAKLLRVLESRQVQSVGADRPTPMNVRFVAATNDDLQRRVSQGLFRTDLYFRLAQYTVMLPPLRQRAGDIPYLTQRFVEEASIELRRPIQAIVPEALDLLQRHSWPGNVRELRNIVRRAVLQSTGLAIRPDTVRSLLGASDAEIPAAVGRRSDQALRDIAGDAATAAEREAVCETLRITAGNKSQAAKRLQTDYKTLHLKMKQMGIRARDFSE
jgi:DNA-binding NtrC family response regulator